MSFKPEVMVAGGNEWAGNALCFATREEAQANVEGLAQRWTLVVDFRVVESDDPVNYRFVDGQTVRIEEAELREIAKDCNAQLVEDLKTAEQGNLQEKL